jgi:hypothetical protein
VFFGRIKIDYCHNRVQHIRMLMPAGIGLVADICSTHIFDLVFLRDSVNIAVIIE